MSLRDAFLSTFRTAPRAAPAAEAPAIRKVESFTPLLARLWQLFAEAQLPSLSDEETRQLALYLEPELRPIVNECIALLRRRPEYGKRLGLTAEALEEHSQMDLELQRMEPLLSDLTQSAQSGTLGLSGALGALTARVLLHVQEHIDDTSLPLAERQRLLTQFGGAFEAEQEQRARLLAPRPATERKAQALMERIEAAEKSRVVEEALDLVRRHGGGTHS